MKKLGIYIHIPFCVRKCRYCDFLSAPAGSETRRRYVKALCREIRAAADFAAATVQADTQILTGGRQMISAFSDASGKAPVDTVFIGGGTPNTLEPEELAMIMECIHDHFRVLPDAEVTMEMNPGVFSEGMLAFVRKYINRVSIGLQSANDEELRMLGRIHTYSEFEECYHTLRRESVANINVDLMSAIPGQTVRGWEDTLKKVVALAPEHISAYSLIIEEGTPFFELYEKGALDLPDEDDEREMYHLTKTVLAEAGYNRYEISNYAKAGFACRHNARYWLREPYFGFGIGAASMYEIREGAGSGTPGQYRRTNGRDLGAYLKRYGCVRDGISWLDPGGHDADGEMCLVQKLTRKESMEEFMFLGLRMTDGILIRRFSDEFGVSVEEVYGRVIRELCEKGLLIMRDGRIALTDRGLDVSNMVMAEFLL